MTAAVLFGAGASFACRNVTPRPPLGYELFARIAGSGPAALLPAEVRATFRAKGFEAGMSEAALQVPELITPLQCQIAVYLLKLKAIGQTPYERFLRTIESRAPSIAWATLNYDLLLEEAVSEIYGHFDYGLSGECIRPGIIKLHGSANFGTEGSEQIRNIAIISPGGTIFESRLLPMKPGEAIRRFSDPQESIGPVMALFMEGKPVYVSRPALEAHRRTWFEAVERASAILLVGVAYNPPDTHIWAPILASKLRIGIVDPRGEEMAQALARDGAADVSCVAREFGEAAFPAMGAFLES